MTQVFDISQGSNDATGAKITIVYSKRIPYYAVYGTEDRLSIQYADDEKFEKIQRTSLAKLNPVRGDINGLIDGWRKSKDERVNSKAERYDRNVADALVVALEGDVESAQTLLQGIKTDIVDERTSRARFEYLLAASAACALLVVLMCIVGSFSFSRSLFTIPDGSASSLWLGAGAGAVGAFFSIAVAIRSRTILTDLHTRDNTSDAILRIVVGVIAAVLLIAMLQSKLVSLSVGTSMIGPDGKPWMAVMIAAFIAGFSERLVPDMLAKSSLTDATATAAKKAGGTAAAPPASKNTSQLPASSPYAADADSTADAESGIDACSALGGVTDGEATADVDLPAASGGVAGQA